MENQNMDSLKRLSAAVEELVAVVQSQKTRYNQELEAKNSRISGLQTEVQNLNNALNNRKIQLEDLDNKNKLLAVQLNETQTKLENSAGNNEEANRLRTMLNEANTTIAEWAEKCRAAEEKLQHNQQEIDETSEQINSVIARLEKVLQENGASNDSN